MSTKSTLRLVAELHAGKNVGRKRAREILGTAVAAADAQLRRIVDLLPVERFTSSGQVFYRWKHDRSRATRTTHLSTVLAGYFGSSLGRLFEQTAYASGMREAAETLAAMSPRATRFENADRKFVFLSRGGELALPDNEAVLSDLVQMLLDSSRAKIAYRSVDGRRRTLVVDPLSVAIYDHQLYMIARRSDGTFHPFRFARIEKITRLSKRIEYPSRSEYDPEQIFRDSIGVYVDERFPVRDIEVRVSAWWARFMRSHRWHRSQKVTRARSGYVLKMRLRLCPEVTRWALGFGAEAEVIEPKVLRTRVAGEARRMAALYETAHAPRASTRSPA